MKIKKFKNKIIIKIILNTFKNIIIKKIVKIFKNNFNIIKNLLKMNIMKMNKLM